MLARMAVNERLTFPPMDVLPDDPRSTIVSTASQKKLVSGKLEQAVKQAIPALRRLVGDRNERVSSQSLDRSIRSGYCRIRGRTGGDFGACWGYDSIGR